MPPFRSIINFKMRFLRRSFGNRPFKLLDVGTGNHSASRTCAVFPRCEYYGLDLDRNYNNDERDFALMKDFYQLDLTQLDYSRIPDAYFDGIWMSHVIEHLPNGDQVLTRLVPKLKPGGHFYIEYPGRNSLRLPSMRGSLNFHDDPTHVRLYSVPELRALFEASGCEVLSCGTRRNPFYIIATPVRALHSLLTRGHVVGNVFWDILGFAEYLWVRKRTDTPHDLPQ
ncbi:MAG: hypothetical protein RJA57_1740 [Bacteroidota bacterium]|jgi:SAM-dependent methyltransferase